MQLSPIHWDPEFSYQIPEEAKVHNAGLIQKHTSPCCWPRQGQCGGGPRRGVQVHRNENNRLKQQTPWPVKNSPRVLLDSLVRACVHTSVGSCVRVQLGLAVGSRGPSRETARTCLHILNGHGKENHHRCSHIHLALHTQLLQ